MSDNVAEVLASLNEGDVVEARWDEAQYPATINGVVYRSMNDDDDQLFVGGYALLGATAIRVVTRAAPPLPPEPPVGWPVGVPDADAPGGVRWWIVRNSAGYVPTGPESGWLSWADLVATGGVPAVPTNVDNATSSTNVDDDWLADMEAAPVGTLVVCIGDSGSVYVHRKRKDGMWGFHLPATIIARYGDPVALHYPKQADR